MRYVCLGHIDESWWNSLSEEEQQAKMQSCKDYDQILRDGDHIAGGTCLESATKAMTVRFQDGEIRATDGPFAETREVIGGILELEADSLEQAVELIKAHPGVRMGPFEIRPVMSRLQGDEERIRTLISEWSRALEAKDAEAMMAHYLPSAVLYDAIPPYKTVGREAIQHAWESCFPHFPDKFKSEHRDLTVEVDGNVAFVHGLHKFVTAEPHPCNESWMRMTVGYRKVNGAWKVSHEHISMPFNPMNNQVWQIVDPEELSQPDYAGCGSERREEVMS